MRELALVQWLTQYSDVIGILAGVAIAAAFTPQLIQIVKSKSAKDISLGMYLIYITGVLLFILFGYLISAWPIVIANCIALVQASIILYFKLRYG